MDIREMILKSDIDGKIYYGDIKGDVYKIISVSEIGVSENVKFYALPFALYVPKPQTEYLIEYAILKGEN